MAEDSKRLVDLTKSVRDVPQYEQLMEYLSLRRAVPPTKFGYIGSDTVGQFERNTMFGKDLPNTGAITLNRGAGADTFVHELTHAAAAELVGQYQEDGTTWGRASSPSQFTRAFDKIMKGSTADFKAGKDLPPVELAKTLDPAWAAKNADYRATAGELLAFGMGNTVPGSRPRFTNVSPAHLDATLATDMMILLDLATRAQKAKPQSQGR